jgi:hypothetical protein
VVSLLVSIGGVMRVFFKCTVNNHIHWISVKAIVHAAKGDRDDIILAVANGSNPLTFRITNADEVADLERLPDRGSAD